MKYVDLHLHTIYSDGADSPENIVLVAKEGGLEAIAITDHDTFFGYNEAKKIAEEKKINLIPGVEMTTREGHILGLGFNTKNKEFNEMLQKTRKIQMEKVEERVTLLMQSGIPISMDKMNEIFPNCSLGKYHIIKMLISDRECRVYFAKKGINHEHEIYRETLSLNAVAGKVKVEISLTAFEAIENVRKAGGVSILAHPSKHGKKPEDFKEVLKKVDGIEIQPKYKENVRPFIEYAKANDLLITYGSDLHSYAIGGRMLGRNDNILEERVLERL